MWTRALFFVSTSVAFAALLFCTACMPSTSDVRDMRTSGAAWQARNDFRNLLKCLDGQDAPADPAKYRRRATWRIETLRTLHCLDERLSCATTEPELHARLLSLTRREYERPEAESRNDHVQAWAVHLLGKMQPPLGAEYFVAAMEGIASPADPDGRVRAAIMGALQLRIEAVTDDSRLRRRVLYQLANLVADLDAGRMSGAARPQLDALQRSLRQQLMSYAATVDLLEAATASACDELPLLELLKWNYQQLRAGVDPAGANQSKRWDMNIRLLLQLAWDPRSSVRSRSRQILTEFAPWALLDALAERLAGTSATTAEDARHLTALLVFLDRHPAGRGDDWPVHRVRSFNALFARIAALSVTQREVIYSKLLAAAPKDLRGGLLSVNTQVQAESSSAALQQLRYMEHVRRALGTASDAALDAATGGYMCHPSAAVRKQVAASLAERQPVLFARCCVPAVTLVTDDPADAAAFAIEAYMAALARLESRNELPLLRKAMAAHPYGVLAHAIAHPEWAVQAKVAAFLLSRDSDLLVKMLSDQLARRDTSGDAIDIRRWCLLGDIAVARKATLSRESLVAAKEGLFAGLRAGRSEQALMCARYLLEIGCDPATIHGPAEVAAMIDMIPKAPKTPDEEQ